MKRFEHRGLLERSVSVLTDYYVPLGLLLYWYSWESRNNPWKFVGPKKAHATTASVQLLANRSVTARWFVPRSHRSKPPLKGGLP
jgi:hypothetical protein